MTDHAIQFTAEQVHAATSGTKTQHRTVLAPQPPEGSISRVGDFLWVNEDRSWSWAADVMCGDRLWVQEEWHVADCYDEYEPYSAPPNACVIYRADGVATYSDSPDEIDKIALGDWGKLRAAEDLPRWASRITLIVTDVRVQRLYDTTLGEICAEGLARSIYDFKPAQAGFQAFEEYWSALHSQDAWCENPWVVALTFDVHKCNIDEMGGGA